MRSRTHIFGLALLFSLGIGVPVAVAQPSASPTSPSSPKAEPYPACTKTVTPQESDAAHTKYLAGRVDFEERNFESAITRFRDAYAKDCTKHEILVILSRAYEGKGDLAEAIRALETYLQRDPTTPDRDSYERRIKRLKDDLAKQPQPVPTPPPSGTGTGATPGASATTAPPPPPPPETPSRHTAWPWVVAALGGAAVTAGTLLLVLEPPLPAACNADTGNCDYRGNASLPENRKIVASCADLTKCQQASTADNENLKTDRQKAGNHVGLNTAGLVCVIGGGALVVGGVVWYLVQPSLGVGSSTEKGQRRIEPQVGPGYAGLSLGGSF